MNWFGAGLDGLLIAIRTVHFTASAVVTGSLIFRAAVAEPALCSTQLANRVVRSQILLTASIGLGIAVVSGLIWLQLQAASMSGLPLREAMASDVLATMLNETQFGLVSKFRFALAIILAACLAYDRVGPLRWLALGAALGLTAAIAWTGHAGATPGQAGSLHLAADVLHLCGASAWIGGLVSLVLLLAGAGRRRTLAGASLAHDAARRFSTLGIVSVAMLVASGGVNAWILVGSLHALLATEYGQLLVLKIVVFVMMLMLAAVNRLVLTPQLSLSSDNGIGSLRQLTRNSVIEICLGLTIFAIVGVLGTLHPAIHLLN
jgi:putative copper resistance protein D